jgi:protein-disulfide isomerase
LTHHFFTVSGSEEKERIFTLWFDLMDLDKYKEIQKTSTPIPYNYSLLQQHKDWSDNSKITFTPTIFINGYQLPKEYEVNDLREMGSELFTNIAMLNT